MTEPNCARSRKLRILEAKDADRLALVLRRRFERASTVRNATTRELLASQAALAFVGLRRAHGADLARLSSEARALLRELGISETSNRVQSSGSVTPPALTGETGVV